MITAEGRRTLAALCAKASSRRTSNVACTPAAQVNMVSQSGAATNSRPRSRLTFTKEQLGRPHHMKFTANPPRAVLLAVAQIRRQKGHA
jgi:hypothetical protein